MGCNPEQIITENVTRTITFSTLNSYSIILNFNASIPSTNIKSQSFEENGRWLFLIHKQAGRHRSGIWAIPCVLYHCHTRN